MESLENARFHRRLLAGVCALSATGTRFSLVACGSSSSGGASAGAAALAGAPSTSGGASAGTSGAPSTAGSAGNSSGGTANDAGSGGSSGSVVGGSAGSGGTANGGASNGGGAGAGGKAGSGGASGSGGSAGAPPNAAWVGTWSVSPQSGGGSFKQQTLRQIVHTSISGTDARVQLSNAFGSQPMNVSDVHIANRTTGSSIDMPSDKAVTFAGKTTLTIPPNGLAVSDSIAFPVAALSDVAVSFYLPDQVSGLTYHQQGTQTNYAATGDVSSAKDLTNPQTSGSYSLLVNLDVKNTA
ncbi:MAG TPA: hypothetical protein VHW01_14155, partial [Polyangiaceae bacterium]|nr:hypothetical protein [Polyangiaceae bacterium]